MTTRRLVRGPGLVFTLGVAWLLPTAAYALIEVGYGNKPTGNMGWPTGAEEVADLPSRLGYKVGPPFGGGEYYFSSGSRQITIGTRLDHVRLDLCISPKVVTGKVSDIDG